MKILVIEDEPTLNKNIKRYLERKNFEVDSAFDGSDGLNKARITNYDCVLLDLNLPNIDGIEICNRLRQEENTVPIIMLTARSQMYNKIEGLDCGADDYITKPFDLKEVVARIKAVIRRNSNNKLKLKIGNWTISEESNEVTDTDSGVTVLLSNKEMGILVYLLRKKGTIVSTEQLLEHVWDSEVDDLTQTVKTHIKTLRQKIDPNKNLIKTIRGKGYII